MLVESFFKTILEHSSYIIHLTSDWGIDLKLESDIEKTIAKQFFNEVSEYEYNICFFNKAKNGYETVVYFENGISNILDSLVLESNGFDFTLYCYDKKVKNISEYIDIKNEIDTRAYRIAYTFQTAHDLLTITFDENYTSRDKIEKDLRKVSDELGLILECR